MSTFDNKNYLNLNRLFSYISRLQISYLGSGVHTFTYYVIVSINRHEFSI